jgi:hypothetical protein
MTGNRPLKHYGEVAHAAPVTVGQGHHTPAPVKAPALADERG